MIQNSNIIKCKNCQAHLIIEELDIHICFTKTIVNFRVDTESNEYYAFDGKVVSLVSLIVEKIFTQFQTLKWNTQTKRNYFFITCFSFSASIPAITNKINPGIPRKVAAANTNTP